MMYTSFVGVSILVFCFVFYDVNFSIDTNVSGYLIYIIYQVSLKGSG